MSQYNNAIPLEMRKNLSSVVIVGRITNKREYASMADEVLHLSKEDMDAVMRYSFQQPHDNLIVRLDTGRMYRNFARLHAGHSLPSLRSRTAAHTPQLE